MLRILITETKFYMHGTVVTVMMMVSTVHSYEGREERLRRRVIIMALYIDWLSTEIHHIIILLAKLFAGKNLLWFSLFLAICESFLAYVCV